MEKRNYRQVAPRPALADDEKQLMIFGLRPVLEALEAGKGLERIYLQQQLNSPGLKQLQALARQADIPVALVPVEKLNKLTRKNHQGVVAYLSLVSYAPLQEVVINLFEQGKTPLVLILDRITDVRNFGAIARSAEVLGAHALIIPSRGGAQINGDAVKTSAGALHVLPVCRELNLKNTIRYLQESGFQIVAVTEKTDQESTSPSLDLTGPVALIMGSEEDGISPEYLKMADAKAKIPLLGTIGSLNVSVAAGIMLYEVLRQRGLQK